MNILWAIIIGAIVGLIAKFVMPGRDPGGFVITALLGIGGSVVASLLGQSLGWYQEGQSAGFIASILGAVLLLFVYRMMRGTSSTPGAVPR